MGSADDEPTLGGEEHSPTILVVEDERLLRITLADHLKDCGFLVIEACDAQEAIEVLEAGVEIEVVLTDVQMPGNIDGFGLAKWIRDNRPELAVFVTSGYSGKLDMARELCAGEQFFPKPYDVSAVAEIIKTHLKRRRPQAPAT